MDRGQLFIGKKLEVDSIEALDTELKKYGHQCRFEPGEPETIEVSRLDGQPTEYNIHYNDETHPFDDGCIFGIEAVAAYVNFTEYTGEQLPHGGERDWIQDTSLDKLAEELARVKKDIPDARALLMDLHY